MIVAGCAGKPSQPAPTAPTKFVSNAPVVVPTASTQGDADMAKLVLDAKRRGYTVVNQNGETLFCHKDARIGSHLVNETTCLTARQMEDLRRQTQQSMQSFQMQMPPPQGK
jgi:hypothetical protein